jgi:hypothetical protein
MNNLDAFRWSLKSVLINHLLQTNSKVLFLDCDLYFYCDFQFLFDELNINNVIHTPHWFHKLPYSANSNFDLLLFSGIYNADIIGCNQSAAEVIDWWAACCEYKCEINPSKGYYVDQTYLNLMLIYFEKVKILTQRGCNVSALNFCENKRKLKEEGSVNINQKYSIIFMHFIKYLFNDFKSGKEHLRALYLKVLEDSLNKYKCYSAPYALKENSVSDSKHEASTFLLRKISNKLRLKKRDALFIKE